MKNPDLIERLRARLKMTLPGVDAQLRLAPGPRMNLEMARIDGKPCRHAAVLALVYPNEDQFNLLLTVRSERLAAHPGQISFPGGGVEGDETLVETALREAEEEVALDPDDVDVIGGLTPLYVPPSNFCVHPFVGYSRVLPALHPSDDEVHALLHVNLSRLFDHGSFITERWTLHGSEIDVPMYRYASYKIWGATAMMLSELQAVMSDLDGYNLPKL